MRSSRRTWSMMSSRAVSAGARCTSVTVEPRRASSSASSVALSPPPIDDDVPPAELVGVRLDLVRHVASERTIRCRGQLLTGTAGGDDECPPVHPHSVSELHEPRLGVDTRDRRSTPQPRPEDRRRVLQRLARVRPSAKRPAATLRTEWWISVSWPPGSPAASNTTVSSWMS